MSRHAAVLFDLDGTLVDSAPDLHRALLRLRLERGLSAFPFERFRDSVSRGGRAMLARGLVELDDRERESLLPRFLEIYAEDMGRQGGLFPGFEPLLARLESLGVPWGIVTNKPGWLSAPLLDRLDLAARCAVLVSGDTLSTRKPDPAPVRHALEQIGAMAARSVYVGDDPRDIEAGRAAGTATAAAAWGYFDPLEPPQSWGADHVCALPDDLGRLLFD